MGILIAADDAFPLGPSDHMTGFAHQLIGNAVLLRKMNSRRQTAEIWLERDEDGSVVLWEWRRHELRRRVRGMSGICAP
jgi:hypothetical protein